MLDVPSLPWWTMVLSWAVIVCIADEARLAQASEACAGGRLTVSSNSAVELRLCAGTEPLTVELRGDVVRRIENISLTLRGDGVASVPPPLVVSGFGGNPQNVHIAMRDLIIVAHPGTTTTTTNSMVVLDGGAMRNISLLMHNCSVVDPNGMGFATLAASQLVENVTIHLDQCAWIGRLSSGVRLIDVGPLQGSAHGIFIGIYRSRLNLTTVSADLKGLITITTASAETVSAVVVDSVVATRVLCNPALMECDSLAVVALQLRGNGSTFRDLNVDIRSTNITKDYVDDPPSSSVQDELASLGMSVVQATSDEDWHRIVGMTIRVEGCTVVIVAKQFAGIVKLDDVSAGIHNATIVVANTQCDLTAADSIVRSRGSRLSAVIVVFDTAALYDATVVVEDVSVRHRMLSGALPSSADNSGLLIVAADAVHIATATHVTFVLLRVHQVAVMDNGTVPCLNSTKGIPRVVCLVGTTVGTSLLRLGSPINNVSNVSVSIQQCTLNAAAIHLHVAAKGIGQILAVGLASYHIALICVITYNLLGATIYLYNTTVVVQSTSLAFVGTPRDLSVVGGAFISLIQMQPVDNLLGQLLQRASSQIGISMDGIAAVFPSGILLLRDATVRVSLCAVDLSRASYAGAPLEHAYTAMWLVPSSSERVAAAFEDTAMVAPSWSNIVSSADMPSSMANPAAIGCFVNCSFVASAVRFVGIRVGLLLELTVSALARLVRNASVVLQASNITGYPLPSGDRIDTQRLGLIHVSRNTGAAILVDDGSAVRVDECVVLHLSQLMVSPEPPLPSSSSSSALSFGRGTIVLGCNLWDGAPFPARWSLQQFGDLPNYAAVAFDSQQASFDGVWCAMPKLSASATLTVQDPAAQQFPQAAAYSPPMTPPSAVVAVAALVSPLDSIALITFGQSACAPSAVRQATSAAQFLISPMYSLGSAASVFGNIGLSVVVLCLHFIAVRAWTVLRTKKKTAQVEDAVATSAPADDGPNSSPQPRASASTTNHFLAADAWAQCRFPNYSIAVGMYLSSGVAFYSSRLLFGGNNGVGSVLLGILALGVLGALCFLWWRLEQRVLRHTFRFERYRAHVMCAVPSVPRWVLPIGRWGPDSVRSKYGRLRGFVRRGHTKYAAMPIVVRLVSSLVMGVPVEDAWWCPVQAVLLSVVAVAATGVLVVVRPALVPATGWLLSALYVLQIGTYTSSAASKLLANDDTSTSQQQQAADNAAMVFSILHTVVALVKSAHTVLLFVWERMRKSKPPVVAGPQQQGVVPPTALGGAQLLHGGGSGRKDPLARRRPGKRVPADAATTAAAVVVLQQHPLLSRVDIQQNLQALIALAASVVGEARAAQ